MNKYGKKLFKQKNKKNEKDIFSSLEIRNSIYSCLLHLIPLISFAPTKGI